MRLFRLGLIICCLFLGTIATEGDNDTDNVGKPTSYTDSTPDSSVKYALSTESEFALTQAPEEKQIWYCSDGWIPYTDGKERKCLYFSEKTSSFWELQKSCRSHNAVPTEVLTEHKAQFLMDIAGRAAEEYVIPLMKKRGYGEPFVWWSSKVAEDHYLPEDIREEVLAFQEKCAYISGYSLQWSVDTCRSDYYYICEKDVDCHPGTFGSECESECHCTGEPCDTRQDQLTCKWGCQQGWTGPTCSTVKEKPEVRYFCINSPEQHVGSYVDVHIHTKGVNHRSIYAQMANSTEKGPWCPGTVMSPTDHSYEHVSITIEMNDTIAREINNGECVGQEVAKNQFEWTLIIQEYEGILLDTDLQVIISCDFNSSESLRRSVGYSSSNSQTLAEKVELTPETTDVTLEVVDPFTHEIIRKARIGSPVKLEIKFGYRDGTLVKGVCPHDCVAVCPDGDMVKHLLDDVGCTVQGSPVQSFSKDMNSSNAISTVWFPLFAFANHDEVEFKCLLDLCFHSDNCEPGCRHSHHSHHRHRHRRAVSGSSWTDNDQGQDLNMDWMSRVIRILPDSPAYDPKRADSLREANGLNGQRFDSDESNKDDTQGKNRRHNSTQGQQQPQPTATKSKTTTTDMQVPHKTEVDVYTLMSPVTCAVLLLLLLVFTAVFFTFYFTLRRSVEVIRQTMLWERKSRDRTSYPNPSLGEVKD